MSVVLDCWFTSHWGDHEGETHRFCGSVATRTAPRPTMATPPPIARVSELGSTAESTSEACAMEGEAAKNAAAASPAVCSCSMIGRLCA